MAKELVSSDAGCLITLDQFRRALPGQLKKSLSDELMGEINNALSDPTMYESYRDNLLSYTSVMMEGKYKIPDYVNAVKYVSHKIMGASNVVAYSKTFPDRYQRLVAQGVTDKDISCHVAAYNKNQLVNKILTQTLVPSYVLNADLYQKALNVQADLMMNARSEKVRCDAANCLLGQLKMPETMKVQLDVGVKVDSSIDALRASTLELVAQQRAMLAAGAMNAREVAGTRLVIEVGDGE